mgnify:CR=1 FL=1
MSNLFDMILEQDGLRFSDFLDDAGKDEIRAFWDNLVGDRGSVTDAEIDSVLSTYKGLGVIVPADSINSDQEKELRALDRTWEAGARGHKPTRSAIAHWLNGGYDQPEIEDQKDPDAAVNDFKKGLIDKTSDIIGAGKEALRSADKKADDLLDALTQEIQSSTAGGNDRKAGAALTGANIDPAASLPPDQAGASPATSPVSKMDGISKLPTLPPGPKADHPGLEASWQLLFQTNRQADERHPLMILSDPMNRIPHHQVGAFTDPARQTAFEFIYQGSATSVKILQLDRRFVHLLSWLGGCHIAVKLSGRHFDASRTDPLRDRHGLTHVSGYAVYKITAVDLNANSILQTANNDFLQLVIRRMLASNPKETLPKETEEELDLSDQTMLMTDMPAIIDYVNCAQDALPSNILNWSRRQIAMVKSESVSTEEQKHAQRALSIMLNVQWQGNYFPPIDPAEAKRILDEELYGMEAVKQRIIETIIQINRTHTLPAYGLLLVGPAGTGKSRVAYAVARILKLPWTSLDMSAIRDTEALTGSPRVYTNAKPGKIMEAFQQAGSSNLVFIINELDKAGINANSGNPADALLTLLDNIGFTDNYMECMIPTSGVYPIATANDRQFISAPLLTRFAQIDIPDYSPAEKKVIFRDYSLRKTMDRMGLSRSEIRFTDEAIDAIIDRYSKVSGVRDLEQAAEHLVAHALYLLETDESGPNQVVYQAEDVRKLLF